MKSLNEVIAIMDGIDQNCTCCAYQYDCDETECVEKTALHYLKEYREEDKKLGAAINEACDVEMKYCRLAEELERNEPLTWEQLKQMEGKPVFFEWLLDEDYDIEIDGSTYQEWLFVYSWRGKDKQILIATNSEGSWHDFYQERQGTMWQAYRKERG